MQPFKAICCSSILLVLLLGGCSVSVRAPGSAFSLVGKARDQDVQFEHAFNTTVVHVPGLTWSITGTYLPGSLPASRVAMHDGFAYRFPGSWSLTIRQHAGCVPTWAGQQRLSRTLDRILRAVGGLPARGSVSLRLVPPGTDVKRYAFALRTGRRYALSFSLPCSSEAPDDALWVAALIAVHESTHAALELAGKQPAGAQNERVAIGSGACLALSLADGRAGFLTRHPLLAEEITDRFELADEHWTMSDWCDVWLAYMRGIGADARAGGPAGRATSSRL